MPLAKNLKQVWALMGGVGEFRKLLHDLSKQIHALTIILRKRVKYVLTPATERISLHVLVGVAAPPI